VKKKAPRIQAFVVKVQRSLRPPGGIMIYDEPKSFVYQAWGFDEVHGIVGGIDDHMPGARKLYVWAHFEGTKLCLDFNRPLPLQTQIW
jgi:hypothetical protein